MDCYSQLCRICFTSSDSMVDLEESCSGICGKDTIYLNVFNSCTQLMATLDDKLPKHLCETCSVELLSSFEFQIKAQKADHFLRSNLEVFNSDADNEMVVEEIIKYEDDEHFADLVEFVGNDSDREIVASTDDGMSIKKIYSSAQNLEGDHIKEETIYEIQFDEETLDIPNENETQAEGQPSETNENFFEYSNFSEESANSITSKESLNNDIFEKKDYVECNDCGKLLKRISLQSHRNRFHCKPMEFLCSSCPKIFTTNSDLKIHMRSHDADRPRNFSCHICAKSFYDKQTCQVHILRHTGVKPFVCANCPKSFLTKNALNVHAIVHNRDMGRYICQYCSKPFATNSDLIVHTRFHTGDYPYECSKCGKRYAVKSHYSYHMAKHEGVIYECIKCSKQFRNRGNLKSHMFTHDNTMPHQCKICNKGMASPFSLRRHMKTHKSFEYIEEIPELQIQTNN